MADALIARGVPFVFATGYDQWSSPERFADAKRLEKPIKRDKIPAASGPLLVRQCSERAVAAVLCGRDARSIL